MSMNINNDGLSVQNKFVLDEYANKLFDISKINKVEEQKSGILDIAKGYIPTPQKIGEYLGWAAATTHGSEITNRSVDLVFKRLFNQGITNPTYWQMLKSSVGGVAQASLAETTKLALTPYAVPVLQTIGLGLGGIAVPAAITLISMVYSQAMHDPKKMKDLQKLSFKELVQIDPQSGGIRDAYGNVIKGQDLKDLILLVTKYDLICKLRDMSKQEVEDLVSCYILCREDNRYTYLNGDLLSEQEETNMHEALRDLSNVNPTCKKEKIRGLIDDISSHSLLMYADPTAWQYDIIPCADGQYCDRTGRLVSQEEFIETLTVLEDMHLQNQRLEQEMKLFEDKQYAKEYHIVSDEEAADYQARCDGANGVEIELPDVDMGKILTNSIN